MKFKSFVFWPCEIPIDVYLCGGEKSMYINSFFAKKYDTDYYDYFGSDQPTGFVVDMNTGKNYKLGKQLRFVCFLLNKNIGVAVHESYHLLVKCANFFNLEMSGVESQGNEWCAYSIQYIFNQIVNWASYKQI